MFVSEVQLRVRYAETDRMGYCYYGNYAQYFEVGRVEALREVGHSYRSLEDKGILLPVSTYSVKYLAPAHYDDLLTVRTRILSSPTAKMEFAYETFNEKGLKLNEAETTLVFVSEKNGKPMRAPQELIESLSKYFN